MKIPELHLKYNTVDDITYVSQPLKFNGHTVPAGFHTDLITTRWYIRWLIPQYGITNIPAVIHDYSYYKGSKRKYADKLFYQNLRLCGVGKIRSALYYIGVRLLGGIYMKFR